MKEYTFISCPYCSHSLVLARFKKTNFPIDPLEFKIFSTREQKSQKGWPRGKGKGHRGFYKVEGSGKNISDLMNGTSEEKEIAKKIGERVKKIYGSYKKVGLVE